jgi:hypothetical protein
MPLNPQLKNRMIYTFSRLYGDKNDIEALLGKAGVPTADIKLDGSAYNMWRNVVDFIESAEQAGPVIATLQQYEPGNRDLSSLEEEFRTGNDTRYDLIANAIAHQQCVLFLGPDALKCRPQNETIPFSQALALQLEIALRQAGVAYDELLRTDLKYMAQRFHTKPNYIDLEEASLAQKLYLSLKQNGLLITDLFDLLARLNFPLVINTNPDNLLVEAMTDGRASRRFYNLANSGQPDDKELAEDKNEPFWKGRTLVYNIFGSFERTQSILMTEADFVRFTKRVFQKNPPLLPRVTDGFLNLTYYLFLGFEFSQWYLKILFEVFDLVRTGQRSISVYMDRPLRDQTMDYFEREYQCFFCNVGIYPLLNALIRRQPQNLNPPPPNQ